MLVLLLRELSQSPSAWIYQTQPMGQQVSHNKAITINKLAVSLFSLFLVPDGWINGWMDVWFWNHNLSAQSDTLYFSLGNAVTTIYRPDLLHL